MRGDVGERVLWQTQVEKVEPLAASPRRPPAAADVVVVGGGYAGLAASRALALAGRDVVVVEARRLGWGAHARNGGMVLAELKHGPLALERRYGELGRRMGADAVAAFDHVEGLVAAEAIDCDYERCGELLLAHTPRLVPMLRSLADQHEQDGDPAVFVPAGELADEIGSDQFAAGVVFERAGSLQPAKFHRGLVSLATDAGATVVDECPAISVEGSGASLTVTTSGGTITAADVIVTTNAYADDLVPGLRRRVMPVGSYIVATEPLDTTVASEISPRRRMFVDTKQFLFYWRLTPDRRMLFGGRRSLRDTSLHDATEFLAGAMRRIHPQVADATITHRWGGHVAITFDRLPHIGRIGRLWYATGCNGSGVALNTWLGHRLGEHVAGSGPLPSFAELPHRPIPLYALAPLWRPVVSQWFHWLDRR